MDEVTSYLYGKIKKPLFFSVSVIIAPVWWNWERYRRILKDVDSDLYYKMVSRDWSGKQPTEIFVNICVDYVKE
jgi:hypothetical protein